MNNQQNLKPFVLRGVMDVNSGKIVSIEPVYDPAEQNKQEVVKPVEKVKNPDLINYVEVNDVSKVKELLDKGCDPNITGLHGVTCMELSMDNNNFKIFKLLVEAGADINQQVLSHGFKMSPLNYLCLTGRQKFAELLISLKVDINSSDLANDTPLHNACRKSFKPKMLKLLIENGADYTKKNEDGMTPLRLCKYLCKKKSFECLRSLIKIKEKTQSQQVVKQTNAHPEIIELTLTSKKGTISFKGPIHLSKQIIEEFNK